MDWIEILFACGIALMAYVQGLSHGRWAEKRDCKKAGHFEPRMETRDLPPMPPGYERIVTFRRPDGDPIDREFFDSITEREF